mmetsp:Transcript_114390/g.255323  ORF Transcript_114390/g.255323 Transcript_114390/m.255323 type:complete len:204 (+) Transcript_114390:195-806(+)
MTFDLLNQSNDPVAPSFNNLYHSLHFRVTLILDKFLQLIPICEGLALQAHLLSLMKLQIGCKAFFADKILAHLAVYEGPLRNALGVYHTPLQLVEHALVRTSDDHGRTPQTSRQSWPGDIPWLQHHTIRTPLAHDAGVVPARSKANYGVRHPSDCASKAKALREPEISRARGFLKGVLRTAPAVDALPHIAHHVDCRADIPEG